VIRVRLGACSQAPASRPAVTSAVAVLAGGMLVALVVAACAGPTSTASPVSPGASPTASASASEAVVGPSPTPWPGGVVEAIVILGKADLEIQKAGGDLGAAAASEDLEAMWGAADGLAVLIEKLQKQVDRIRDYPVSADAATAYDAAFPDMLAGAKGIRDAISAKDSAALTDAVQQLGRGTAAYAEARRQMGPLVDQAILMQRVLVK
jgi:hypothetical protein